MFKLVILVVLITWCGFASSNIGKERSNNNENIINITKCCELNEILVDDVCTLKTLINDTEPWQPKFVDEKSSNTIKTSNKKNLNNYNVQIGLPSCEKIEHQWQVYNSQHDTLIMLSTGKLRHYINKQFPTDVEKEKLSEKYDEEDLYDDVNVEEPFYVDYSIGHYCIDKAVLTKDKITTIYAIICVPPEPWTDIDYLIRHIANPVIRALSISSYILVAIVYFVLPQLRDLVGNMITSMNLCLVVHQIAITITIFKEYANHFSFLIAGQFNIFQFFLL